MAVAETPTATVEQAIERLNVYMPAALRPRLKRAATLRKTSESATIVLALEKWLDWFEGLSRDQREAV